MGLRQHRKRGPLRLGFGILTATTTRSLAEDKSGRWMRKKLHKAGQEVLFHQTVADDAATISRTVTQAIHGLGPDIILVNGGTGVTAQDVTIEALRPLFDKELTAFGILFAQLSYEQIDSAAMLSRATAGVIERTAVFCMPGSLKAVKLACNALIFPEMGHLMGHVGAG